MSTQIYLGEPPPNVKQWIIDHSTPPAPATHAATWYKYAGDTEWRTVDIQGSLYGDDGMYEPTTQIPDITNVVAVEIGTDVTFIESFAFGNCTNLTSVTIPDTVTGIGVQAFMGCGITSIETGNNVYFIGGGAFQNCENLSSVTINDYTQSIENGAFHGCSNLKDVTFEGKTFSNVQQILWEDSPSYPFGLGTTPYDEEQFSVTLHCTDGNHVITPEY